MAFLSNFIGIILCSSLIQLCYAVESSYPEYDKINALPGQPQVNFSQYGGYINVDDNTNRSLYYYFVEAETDPSSKPLYMWLSGGPGGCCVCNAFGSTGPFVIRKGNLVRNENSMNKVANILYVDSPAQVGLSYFPNGSISSSLDDDVVAQDDLVFLQRWLEKFTVYRNRDLYLGGESYAGHSVPNLAKVIIKSNLKSNLKGLMLISPLIQFDSDMSYEHKALYLWTHGLISDSAYELLRNSSCNMIQYQKQSYVNDKSLSPSCQEVNKLFLAGYKSGWFDEYGVTSDKCPGVVISLATGAKIDPNSQLCGTFIANIYLAQPEVTKAMNAKYVHPYFVNLDIFGNYSSECVFKSMVPTLDYIIRSGVRVLVASGDQDGQVSFLSTKSLLNTLASNIGLRKHMPYKPWIKDLEKGQIGGWIQSYGQGKLTFLTVKGGHHYLPKSHTRELLMLFEALINNKFEALTR